MKARLIATMVIASSLIFPAVVAAHGGASPKHGGVVQTASDLSFELVPQSNGAVLYVEDHGKPMNPAGITGKLTVLNGNTKSEAPLAVSGDRLEAKGVQISKGARVVASLSTASKKAITVRFTVR